MPDKKNSEKTHDQHVQKLAKLIAPHIRFRTASEAQEFARSCTDTARARTETYALMMHQRSDVRRLLDGISQSERVRLSTIRDAIRIHADKVYTDLSSGRQLARA